MVKAGGQNRPHKHYPALSETPILHTFQRQWLNGGVL